jgi:autotransporter strand-loop-strand O-heptosyltransferase
MQKIVCDQLNIPYTEIRPSIKESDKFSFERKKKYVCISTQSTSQLKYWNNGVGWDKTVRYLKKLGYDVYAIDKDYSFGVKEKWNLTPSGAKNETGSYPIEYRIAQIKNSEFFIGVSSGLTWLAWSLGKSVITISGCTIPTNEFISNNYRVINTNVCHGCLNDEMINNKDRILSDGWFYCPRNRNFECSKEITFEMVKEKIDQCIKDLNISA